MTCALDVEETARALERVLRGFVDRDFVTVDEATELGRRVLGDACRRLHGLEP